MWGLRSSLFFIALASGFSASGAEYFCYLPGANGLTGYIKNNISKTLVMRGLPFIAFDPGASGSVQIRSQRFLDQFSEVLKKDPSAKCHLFGYSMGGVISRWSANHGKVVVEGQERAFKDYLLSQTTAASPHFGTPLAKILRKYWSSAAPGVEDLSEERMRNINDASSPDHSPVLEDVPFYSYRTFITKKEDADQALVLMGFQLIWQDHLKRGLDPLNDGIVPTQNQGFGRVLGDLNISHGYFHHETGFKIRLEDFLEAHWSFLTKGTKPLIF